jgi:DNA-binding NarL/FixJ family response regulator
LILLDISLPDKNGLELIKDIRALKPGLPILVVSMHDECCMPNASCGPAAAATS